MLSSCCTYGGDPNAVLIGRALQHHAETITLLPLFDHHKCWSDEQGINSFQLVKVGEFNMSVSMKNQAMH